MKDFKEYQRITEYLGHRLRIEPTFIGRTRTQFGEAEVVYANMIVRDLGVPDRLVPSVAIFQKALIAQIKSWYDGRPISGTLAKRHVGDSRLRGQPEVFILDDVKIG